MQIQTTAKSERVRTLWPYGHDGASGEELLNERKRITEVIAAFECILRHATEIFEEEDDDAVYCLGDAASVLEWI